MIVEIIRQDPTQFAVTAATLAASIFIFSTLFIKAVRGKMRFEVSAAGIILFLVALFMLSRILFSYAWNNTPRGVVEEKQFQEQFNRYDK